MQQETKKWYRPDITGLRTLAIVPVVAFHAGLEFLPGGFVGVDVFYAISGFLITTLLISEVTRTGGIRFLDFWSRRVRRLVPALVLVVVVTLIAVVFISSVLSWQSIATQGIASVLYVSNFLFWRQATDYFQAESSPSPFLHTWSLSVEEQFYIVWPVLILVVYLIARRAKLNPRRTLAVVFGVVFVTSFALSVSITASNPSFSFYLLPTRAWEFAAGALVALLPLSLLPKRVATNTVLGLAGIGGLVATILFLTPAEPFPGWVAIIPVASTLAVVCAGVNAQTPVSSWLSTRPMVYIGNLSYSWYLWHWPFIVLAVAAFQNDAWWLKCIAAGASFGAAALTYRYLENRIRFSPRLTKSVKRTYVMAGSATLVTMLVAVGVFAGGQVLKQNPPFNQYATASEDIPDHDCADVESTSAGDLCLLGDLSSDKTVMIVGDSHAGHWKEAATQAALAGGYRLAIAWKSACPAMKVTISAVGAAPDRSCLEFQDGIQGLIRAAAPDAVIVSNAFGYMDRIRASDGSTVGEGEQLRIWTEAFDELISAIRSGGSTVGVIADNPRLPGNPIDCLARLSANVSDCVASYSEATRDISAIEGAQDAAITELGIKNTFSVTDQLCADDICPALDPAGVPFYQDHDHLSKQWTLTQVDRLEAFMATLM